MPGQQPKNFPALSNLDSDVKLFTQNDSGDYSFSLQQLIDFLNSQGITPSVSASPGNAIEVLPDGIYVNSEAAMNTNGYIMPKGTAVNADIGKMAMLEDGVEPDTKVASVYQQTAGESINQHLGRILAVIGNSVILDGSLFQPFELHYPSGEITEAQIKEAQDAVPVKAYDDGKVTPALTMGENEKICGYMHTPGAHGDTVTIKMT